jgi:PAB-dependent poly(A)-specific ribonuclease subunit 2
VTVTVPSDGPDVLLDEYIVATERVCDYLTRFSGLNPGDLDTASSSFRLHAFKSTYLRLRALLDGGAVLVGHGLRKDARELGILVPPAQAADTVRLWKLPHQRFLSLKFLASYLLGADIQGTVHDSGEDARAALRLYQAWERVRAAAGAEGVERLTHALYQLGRENGWRAAGAAIAGGVADAGFAAAAAALAGAGVESRVLLALGFPAQREAGVPPK